jgi:hypothetical protein
MLAYNVYAIGQTAQIEAFQTDAEGEPESPASPRILLKPPTGPEVELEVTENPVGHFYHSLYLSSSYEPGRYFYRILTEEDALERFFVLKASAFTTPLPP